MSEIRLFLPPCPPTEDSAVFWVIPGENRQGRCTLSQLPTTGKVLVFLPAPQVGEHCIEVPDATSKQVGKLLPHALEDHLLCEVDTLTLAWRSLDATTLLVQTIPSSYLNSWLSELAKHSIKPESIWSESALLPVPSAGEVLLGAGPHGCLLRQHDATSTPMPIAATALLSDLFPGATLRCLIAPAAETMEVPLALPDESEHSRCDWTLNTPQGVSFSMGQRGKVLDLQIDWRQWKPVFLFATILLSLLFIADFARWLQLKHSHSQITARFTQLLKEHAPGTPIVDPQLQLEALVTRNQVTPNDANQKHPILLLKTVTPILTAAGLPSPARIEGKANQLELYFSSSAIQDFPTPQLSQLGLAAKVSKQGDGALMTISRVQP